VLDLLLQRADDLPLWEGADLRYVVVDEFHTYDGAQGTDVAMLLRRLAAATGRSEPGRPLGRICPVATSATLGEGGDGDRIREVAHAVFGTEFDKDSIIAKDRLRGHLSPLAMATMAGAPLADGVSKELDERQRTRGARRLRRLCRSLR
jgi:ATP-dependent helicase YprA (DUF1998 family)